MFRFKPDQGVYARGTAFWALTGFAALAGSRFYYWTQSFGDWALSRLVASQIPVLGVHLTPSLLLGLALFGLMTFAAWKVVNHEKLATLLIDTEAEMKKVTWPSFEDSKKSSLVVIGCVVFMLMFLGVADFALNWLFRDLIY